MKHLTDSQLVKRYEAIEKRISRLNDRLIAEGLGGLTPSGMRMLKDEDRTKTVTQFLELLDEAQELIAEARRRYGPDLITVRQLRWRSKK